MGDYEESEEDTLRVGPNEYEAELRRYFNDGLNDLFEDERVTSLITQQHVYEDTDAVEAEVRTYFADDDSAVDNAVETALTYLEEQGELTDRDVASIVADTVNQAVSETVTGQELYEWRVRQRMTDQLEEIVGHIDRQISSLSEEYQDLWEQAEELSGDEERQEEYETVTQEIDEVAANIRELEHTYTAANLEQNEADKE